LIEPDGHISCDNIEGYDKSLKKLFATLPYSVAADEVFRSARSFDAFLMDFSDVGQINNVLTELGNRLIPPSILTRLKESGNPDLTIITDRELGYIPFSCLRIDEKYMIEDFNLLYWSSVSSWLLCEGVTSRWKEGLGKPQQPIIIGNPVFKNPYVMQGATGADYKYKFEPLPGSLEEAQKIAELLGISPQIGDQATFSSIMNSYREARVADAGDFIPILHLATHGVLNMSNPEDSFVALSDGPFTASYLYQFDPGIRSHFVMLSCCQTGLGAIHPDSFIGLVNAFLIAGACSVGSALWKVPDNATQKLMISFYEELKQGANLSVALAKAQRLLLSEVEWQHPLFWGAFKITGSNINPIY